MDEHVTQELSAYLDDELDPETRARVAALLDSSGDARVALDRLAAGRDLVRAGATAPTAAEAAAVDSAVSSALAGPRTSRTGPRARDVPAVASRRKSPHKRGRPPWPYFAAAASLAVVLSLGIIVLAQVFGRGSTNDRAAVVSTTAESPATAAGAPPGSADSLEQAPTAAASPRPRERPGPAGNAAAGPALYLSGATVQDDAGLAGFAAGAPNPDGPRDDVVNQLVELASAAGLDGDGLARCLGTTAPAVPARVDVGTFGGAPAYIIVLVEPGSPEADVVALTRQDCVVLGTVTAPR